MADKACVAHLVQFCANGGVMDFLQVVQLGSAGVACGVDVADNIFTFFEPAQDVTVHDLHMVNIEQQLEAGRIDLSNKACDPVEVVSLVAGVAFHGVIGHPAIEMLDANCDFVFFAKFGQFFPAFDARCCSLVTGDFVDAWFGGISPAHAHKSNHPFDALGAAFFDGCF